MRIFLISNMYPSQTDKLYGVFVKNMHKELIKQQVAFPYKALIRGKAQSRLGKTKKYIRHYFRISSLFFKKDYDLLYVHYLSHHILLMWILLPFKRKPWIVNVHGTDIIDLLNTPALNFWTKKVLKKIDLLVVPSNYFEQKILENYSFFDPKKIYVSPSGGINLKNFYPKTESKNNSELILGFVSRFETPKGWLIFLKAIELLKQKGVNCDGLIIGKGPDKEKISTAIQRHNLEKEVSLIGFVPQNKLVKYFQKMDLYIFPTYREAESLGLTGLEAMACGTPVIGSNIGGLKTYIQHNENGLLFEPRNEKDLADKIQDYLAMPGEQKKLMRENALQTAERYEQSAVAEKLKRQIAELLK